MFGNSDNTSELMLPILLDMANLIRKAVRSGKEQRDVKQPYERAPPQILRRSFTEDTELDDAPFVMDIESTTKRNRRIHLRNNTMRTHTGDKIQNTVHKVIPNKTDTKADVSKLNDNAIIGVLLHVTRNYRLFTIMVKSDSYEIICVGYLFYQSVVFPR